MLADVSSNQESISKGSPLLAGKIDVEYGLEGGVLSSHDAPEEKEVGMRSVFLLFLLFLVSGCASTGTVKEAKGQGTSRTYEFSYEKVFDATLAAAEVKKLKVVESDKDSGQVILSHGVTLWSWGERIAIFLKAIASETTEVEIVSKPVLSPLNFPPDWQNILLEEINVQLQAHK